MGAKGTVHICERESEKCEKQFRGNQSDMEPMDDFIVSAAVAHSIISLSRGRARARISQQNRRPLRTQAAITH